MRSFQFDDQWKVRWEARREGRRFFVWIRIFKDSYYHISHLTDDEIPVSGYISIISLRQMIIPRNGRLKVDVERNNSMSEFDVNIRISMTRVQR